MTTPAAPPEATAENPTDRRPLPFAIKATLTAAIAMIAASLVTVTSLALFTDTESVGSNDFSTGTVDIATAPTSAAISDLAMAPGDQVTQPLTVTNSGSLDLRYAIESTTTEDVLAAELVLTVKTGVTTCTDAGFGTDGTQIYSGRLGSTGTDAIVGSAVAGAQVGDRTLAPAANEVLCLNVTLPLSTTAGQGESTTATFDFLAEQTANNP